MRRRWLAGFALFVASAFAVALAPKDDVVHAKPGKDGDKDKDKDKDGKGKDGKGKGKDGKGKDGDGEKEIRKAYDDITDVSLISKTVGPKGLGENGLLFDRAKEIYRASVKAQSNGERDSARELGHAAHDAARGFKHLLRASAPPVPDLPAPGTAPIGDRFVPEPWVESREHLERASERITQASEWNSTTAGRAFLEGSKRVYEQARRAYLDKDYPRAEEFAKCAEAWTHVGEHLQRVWGEPEPLPTPKERGSPIPPPPPLK